MRRAARTDANQPDIVKELRRAGASVAITASAGSGFPDLVVGYRGVNYLMEIKDPNQDTTHQKLTPDQEIFHGCWTGQISVVKTADQALKIIGAIE